MVVPSNVTISNFDFVIFVFSLLYRLTSHPVKADAASKHHSAVVPTGDYRELLMVKLYLNAVFAVRAPLSKNPAVFISALDDHSLKKEAAHEKQFWGRVS
jgi:hypothetical protein